jgi:hypothetical protein
VVKPDVFETPKDVALAAHFTGDKAKWKKPYAALAAKVEKFGSDVKFGANQSYINLLRDGKKFGIVAVTADRMDIGIKLKSAATDDRFQPSGKWNAMVTHRVHITDPKQIDAELVKWLKQAYEAA